MKFLALLCTVATASIVAAQEITRITATDIETVTRITVGGDTTTTPAYPTTTSQAPTTTSKPYSTSTKPTTTSKTYSSSTTKKPSTTTTKPYSSSTTKKPSTTVYTTTKPSTTKPSTTVYTTTSVCVANPWAQCGGTGFTGCKNCPEGYACTVTDAYFSQCAYA